jgi:hypothetical protein
MENGKGLMKIVITENKRMMLIKTELKKLFDELTPTRSGGSKTIVYLYFDEVFDDNFETALVYRPNNSQLIIYSDYFASIRIFVSSEEELVELIAKEFEEQMDKPVRYYELMNNYI